MKTQPANREREPAEVSGTPVFLKLATTWAIAAGAAIPLKAHAVDGCLVLLCFAAPSWRAISQCVPPIQTVLRDLARGRPFPSCSMSGDAGAANNRWSTAPDFCPVQYTTSFELESGTRYQCRYHGAVSVTINGSPWSRTWWSLSGETVTEYLPAAKAALGSFDRKFDDDYAAWLAAQPSTAAPCPTC